jgi:cyanophycin synthetase
MTASVLPAWPAPPADPEQIRLIALHATRGANFWSRRPITRMDLDVGEYDEISSADVPGVRERLASAMPGLVEHRCSIGERGGFLLRLARGTYAPHIVEHVALELQSMIGHDVGYGRTRGGDVPGEYTIVFEHHHEGVGLRAAWHALDIVKRAFAGTLDTIEPALAELRAIAETPAPEVTAPRVLCAVTGGEGRAAARDALATNGFGRGGDVVVDVAPSDILQAGLPFARAERAIILDVEPADVPERYRDRERARRLVSVVIDAVPPDGIVIVPAKEWELQDEARDAGCRVAVFSTRDDVTERDTRVARAAAWVRGGRIVVEHLGEVRDCGALVDDASAAAQVAAALARYGLDAIARAERGSERHAVPLSVERRA